jgi:two-component system chemotaxis response regulator CheY
MAKVLLVDDAAFMRMRCARLLREEGHEVIEAANGREALEMYQNERPDAVLMDITMPEMDGLEALKAIKAVDPHAQVAMLTAMGQQAIVIEAIKSGARDFVVKPFERERVLAAVAKLVA